MEFQLSFLPPLSNIQSEDPVSPGAAAGSPAVFE